ncbi:hypothetical protein B7C42_00018 [Nocardia cerradoensis]|uniref:Uncharacterized protein n=1 Tax=Nocardia cerradoensis TaxID=85688 RepID=A0A231HDD1_9NOCA|nr:hypothetical protein B7C42_00018 [Nocardia cerradoensis]
MAVASEWSRPAGAVNEMTRGAARAPENATTAPIARTPISPAHARSRIGRVSPAPCQRATDICVAEPHGITSAEQKIQNGSTRAAIPSASVEE